MRHIRQEHTLHLTRLPGTLRLTTQLILLAHQVADVSPYAECTQQLAMLVEFRDTVDLHPLILSRTPRHYRIHLTNIYQRFTQGLSGIGQGLDKLIFLIHEYLLQLFQFERTHHGVQTIIEL